MNAKQYSLVALTFLAFFGFTQTAFAAPCVLERIQFGQTQCYNDPSSSQVCVNPPAVQFDLAAATTNLYVNYDTNGVGHCSNVAVRIWLDDVLMASTGFVPPDASSGYINLGPAAAGHHIINFQGIGQTGGCNVGTLKTWGGFAVIGLPAGQCTAPTNIVCSTNSQCGADTYQGGPFCQGNSTYRNYTSYTCNSPGTASSFCSNNTVAQLQATCSGSQTCSSGSCTGAAIACSTNSQCGTDVYSGGNFCQGNSVYRNYTAYTCNNAGTASSFCSNNTAAQLQNTCSGSQTCSSGSCLAAAVTCSSNSQCGTDGVTGGNFCQGNSVYRNYTTYTCNSAGTTSSYCSNSTTNQLQQSCTGSQTCSSGSCSLVNTCANHSYTQCSANGVYWYDSCGNRQELYQACSTNQTCSNNSCVTIGNTCTGNSYLQCSGNAVYWFNSCGIQQSLYQTCSSGQICSNNTCVTQNQNQNQSNLLVTTRVRNLSSGNLVWGATATASPSDILEIQITLQNTGSQIINNIIVKDTLPANMYYYNNLTIDGVANSGNIISGLNIGSITVGQTKIITYQLQIAPSQNFPLGSSNLSNSITISGNNGAYSTSLISVFVTRSLLGGAAQISTGWTDNIFFDSFIIPLLLLLAMAWAWWAGIFKKRALPAWIASDSTKKA